MGAAVDGIGTVLCGIRTTFVFERELVEPPQRAEDPDVGIEIGDRFVRRAQQVRSSHGLTAVESSSTS